MMNTNGPDMVTLKSVTEASDIEWVYVGGKSEGVLLYLIPTPVSITPYN